MGREPAREAPTEVPMLPGRSRRRHPSTCTRGGAFRARVGIRTPHVRHLYPQPRWPLDSCAQHLRRNPHIGRPSRSSTSRARQSTLRRICSIDAVRARSSETSAAVRVWASSVPVASCSRSPRSPRSGNATPLPAARPPPLGGNRSRSRPSTGSRQRRPPRRAAAPASARRRCRPRRRPAPPGAPAGGSRVHRADPLAAGCDHVLGPVGDLDAATRRHCRHPRSAASRRGNGSLTNNRS